jgi:serine/threonine-protein kinase HipA
MSTLDVWLGSDHLATLERTASGELRLRYDQTAIDSYGPGAVILSVALPVATRHRGRSVEFWAESWLPEGETRTVVEQRFGVRRGDSFGLLEAIGADCAGAVSFLPPGDAPVQGRSHISPLDNAGLSNAIAQLPSHPLGIDDDVRVSLGGLQAKLLLVELPGGRWARPTGGAPSTHIAKPDPTSFPGLVVAEAFTLALSAEAGIAASDFVLRDDWAEQPVLLIRRFDRRVEGEIVVRLHQEDGAAVLGIDPSGRSKYQSLSPSSPSLARLARTLVVHGIDARTELSRLATAATLRAAVGDSDGHVRNYGLLHRGNAISLAPVYDVAPTSLFAATKELGLWVGGQAYLQGITRGHLVREFASWGTPERIAASQLDDDLERMADAVDAACDRVPQVADSVVAAVTRRIERLRASSRT